MELQHGFRRPRIIQMYFKYNFWFLKENFLTKHSNNFQKVLGHMTNTNISNLIKEKANSIKTLPSKTSEETIEHILSNI